MIEYFRGTDELESATGSPADAQVVDAPGASRYELRLGGRLIGLAAFAHYIEQHPDYEGLVAAGYAES